MWQWLRGRRLGKWKFRRQYPIGPYIVDFYCDALKLVVEIDGAAHASNGGYDEEREGNLREMGMRILRISSDRVLQDADGVLQTILLAINDLPLTRSRCARPTSPEGEVREP